MFMSSFRSKLTRVFVGMGVFSLIASANALASVSFLGGVGTGSPSMEPKSYSVVEAPASTLTVDNVESKLMVGFGALFEKSIAPVVGVEIGAFYFQRKGTTDTTIDPAVNNITSIDTTRTTKHIHVPLLLRISPVKIISVGVGPAVTMGLGNIKQDIASTTSGVVATDSAENTYEELGLKKFEFGVEGALGIVIPLAPAIGFRLEGRYHYGLTDVDKDEVQTQKSRDILAMAGVTIGI